MRAEVDSPTFPAGLWDRDGVAMLHPARLAWGLKQACLGLGVRIYERTRATDLASDGAGMAVRTPYGRVFARHVALGTNAFPSLVKRVRPYIVPVYDYALMTEPLTDAQLASIGWQNRQGLADSDNHFHYFRSPPTTASCGAATTSSTATAAASAPSSTSTRPRTRSSPGTSSAASRSWRALRFTHTWGGAIDTCSRFSAFFGTRPRAAGSPTPPATPASA